MLHGALNKTLPSKQNSGDLLHQLALRRFGCLRSGVDLGTTTSGRRYWFRSCARGWSCACSRWWWCRLRPRWSLLFSLEPELFQTFGAADVPRVRQDETALGVEGEVLGGDAVKACHPGLQTGVVAVDTLHVPDAIAPFAMVS